MANFKTLSEFLAEEEHVESVGSLSSIFEEEPVDLITFLQDAKYLGLGRSFVPSDIQADAIAAIERVYYADLYPRMAEEFEFSDYWSRDIPMRNIFTFQWGKGCLIAGEELYDSVTGQWIPVENAPSGKTAASTSSGRIVSRDRSASFLRGRGASFEVVTSTGLKLKVFGGHKFLTPSGYRKLWDLGVGDQIAQATRLPIESPVPLSPLEVELIGWWLGVGILPGGGAPTMMFSDNEVESMRRYAEVCESLGIPLRFSRSGGKNFWYVSSYADLSNKRQNALVETARRYELLGKSAYDVRVPSPIFSSPDDQVALFLSRLWTTDGYVHVPKQGPAEIGYVSVNEDMVRDVQRLLLRLGISSDIRSRAVEGLGKASIAWEVRISAAPDILAFCAQIHLLDRRVSQDRAVENVSHSEDQKSEGRVEDIRFGEIVSITPIGDHDYFDLTVDVDHNYIAGGGLVNHNSGKDLVSRLGSLRVAYLLLCLKSPQDYFGLPDVDSVHLLNVASNAPQALRAFFNPMKKAVQRGWFKDKAHPTQNSIQYDKNIEAISGHSDAEGQEGLNILFGVLDEIDAFKSRDELVGTGNRAREASTTAEGLLEMVRSSAASRFPQTYKRVAISYPRYLGSTIQKLTTEGRESNDKYGARSIHFVSGPHATWEVNPRIRGREDFQEEYDQDPEQAAAKYECRPKRATNPFYRNFDIIKGAVDSESMPIEVDYRLGKHYSKHYHREIEAWEPVFTFSEKLKPVQGAIYAVHADLAIKGDRAGVAMSHVEKWQEYEEELTDSDGRVYKRTQVRPIVRNDFTFGFEASLEAKKPDGTPLPREIQIRWVRQLVDILHKRGFHIALFTADSFQSADTLQILEWEGIETDKMSTDRDPSIYASIKDIASDGRLRMPFDQLLMNELEALTKLDNGKIDHPPSGSKDLSDAFACSIVSAITVGGEEDPEGSIVTTGETYFETGPEMSRLEGTDQIESIVGHPMGLPIGFKEWGNSGW